jgi:hypothetical protein
MAMSVGPKSPRPTAKPHARRQPRPGDRRLGHRLFLLGFIAAPLVVLALLVYGILLSFVTGPSMMAEPVGAGAGNSGGANAVGESLFGTGQAVRGIPAEQTARGAALVVMDASGRSDGGHPVVVLTNHGQWSAGAGLRMELRGDGSWYLRLPAPVAGEPEALAFRFVVLGEGGAVLRELDEAGEPVGERRLPRVPEGEAVGDGALEYRFRVGRFGE